MGNNSWHREYHTHEALMRYAKMLGYGEIHTKIDRKTGLHAIVAIHNTDLGPAIGGCRLHTYGTTGPALKDVLRLAYMMTLKSAISNLPHGGAKAVLIKPKHIKDRKAYFRSFGDFVHQMNGSYITAIDVGTTTEDMDAIAERTPYVIGAAGLHEKEGDPAPHTAKGILRGIQAAIQFKYNKSDLNGIRVAIQGTGHCGGIVAELLAQQGAEITVSDINAEAVQRCLNKIGTQHHHVDPDKIYDVDCDVFAPCAMGGVINLDVINRLKAKIIAGSANNQLAHSKYSELLFKKGILYAPDFVINSGGLINAAMVYDYCDDVIADKQIDKLYDTLLSLFKRGKKESLPTTNVAELMAIEKLTTRKDPIMETVIQRVEHKSILE